MRDSSGSMSATHDLQRGVDSRYKPVGKAKVLSLLMSTGVSLAAHAQTAPADGDVNFEEVVVSASRIERSGFTAPTPTTTIGEGDRELRASTTIANLLNELPSIRPTAPALTSQNTGIQAINLRGLNGANNGSTRTLVLVNGHRFVPTTVTGVVDSNVVPTALIERVEVVTGGASAAWGSDAVAGVTNFIFKKSIEGVQLDAQYGQSQRADNEDSSISLAWGTPFASDRGQFMVAGEYSALKDRQTFGDRDWSNRHTGFVAANGITRVQVDGLTMSGLTTGGVITAANGGQAAAGPLRGIQFGPGGTPQTYTYGTNVGNTTMIGGSGGWFQDTLSLSAPVERKNVYARTTYDITDHFHGALEGSFMRASSRVLTFPLYNPNADGTIAIRNDNAYLQTLPTLATLRPAVANSATAFNMGRINSELGQNEYYTANRTTRFVGSLAGDFGASWKWDGYYTHGKTDYEALLYDHLNEPNWRAALDTVVENGQIICRVNSTVAANIAFVNTAASGELGAAPGCVPANPFGPGSLSPAASAYVTGTQRAFVSYKQDAGGVSLQGEPFSTWADKVSVAGGFEYRKESVDGDSDPISKLLNGSYINGGFQYGNPKPIKGSYDVREAFVETVLPILAKLPGAESLDLNGAIRRTDYSSSGLVTTWKGGFTYKPIDSLLIRGTKSRDIRAPNLNELYASSTLLVFTATDYGLLTGAVPTSYNTQQVTTGNINLKPEKADTVTVGASWSPDFLGLHASVDYYRIAITDVIAARTAQIIVNSCYGQSGPQNAADCASLVRDPSTGRITQVNTFPINSQLQQTQGVDYELSYKLDLSGDKNLTLRSLVSNVKQNRVLGVDRAGEIGTGTSTPHWRGNLSATYIMGPWVLFGQGRYIQSGKYDNTFGPTAIADNDIPSRTYFDGTLAYNFDSSQLSRLQVYGRVTNITDKDPPVLANANQNSSPTNTALYDVGGRSFTVGVRATF